MTPYQKTIAYLFSQLPIYQRIGPAAYKADLSNTLALCDLLGQPQRKFRSIHVAGTNGKGSVSHFMASILQEAGLKVGLYTSPHLKDFRERIRINGRMIPKAIVNDFVNAHRHHFEMIRPSFFEMTVGLAFDYFARERVDIAVLETGLGGRLDSTNVVVPELAVITNIGYDHMQFLGNTLEAIAVEKAGIIKEQVPVVIGERQRETEYVFMSRAAAMQSPLTFASDVIHLGSPHLTEKQRLLLHADVYRNGQLVMKAMASPLAASYQLKNIATVVQAVMVLREMGFAISNVHIRKGILKVIRNTGIAGRWQVLSWDPLAICDVGHNKEGIAEVMKQIGMTPHHQLHMVIGMVKDKNPGNILDLLPRDARYYFCRASIPRALDQDILAREALKYNLKGEPFPSVREAYIKALQEARTGDLVFVGGSTFVVAEVL
jgi:dihydrofolate synthase/folylpolyglutamate synthase